MIRSRVEADYRGHRIVTEASSLDGAIWTVKVTVLQDREDETWVIKRLEPGASATFRTSPGASHAGMLLGREWIERWERRELPVTFVIVDRDRPHLVEGLKNRFAGDPSVRIIFDRRIRLGDSPAADERRWDAEGVNAGLSSKGYIIIDGVSAPAAPATAPRAQTRCTRNGQNVSGVRGTDRRRPL